MSFQRGFFSPERLAELNARQQHVLQYLIQYRSVTNTRYRELTGAPSRTAALDLNKLVNLGLLRLEGRGRYATYHLVTWSEPSGADQEARHFAPVSP